jgi:DNA-binding YbaB/EbfC family protein
MFKGDLGGMLRKAQQVQENIQKAQAEIERLEVVGESGAGMVKVTLNGKHEAKRVWIEPKLLGEDKDMLEDLIMAAINDAARKISTQAQEKMAGLTAGFNLPPGMKLPF